MNSILLIGHRLPTRKVEHKCDYTISNGRRDMISFDENFVVCMSGGKHFVRGDTS